MAHQNGQPNKRQTCSCPEHAAPLATSLPDLSKVFRVYEATDPFHPVPFRLAVSLEREARLLADIDCGRRLLRLGPVVLETRERTLARTMAEAFFM